MNHGHGMIAQNNVNVAKQPQSCIVESASLLKGACEHFETKASYILERLESVGEGAKPPNAQPTPVQTISQNLSDCMGSMERAAQLLNIIERKIFG